IRSDPTAYDPVTHPTLARLRRNFVLRDMLDQQDITRDQYRLALLAALPSPTRIHLPGTQGPAQYFTNYVKQLLVDRYGTGRVFGGGARGRAADRPHPPHDPTAHE